MPRDEQAPCGPGYIALERGRVSSPEGLEAAVRNYIADLGYTGLEVTEVMDFKRNYRAFLAE